MFLALCLGLAFASPGRIVWLERAEYASAHGTFRLVVDPTERQGSGAGWYRMSSGDSVLWQGRLPFTLQKALVAESGVVVGYAFTHGARSSRGHLIAVRIDEAGTACVVGSTERKPPCCPDSSPEPGVSALVWREGESRFAVHVREYERPRGRSWELAIDAGPARESIWTGWNWTAQSAEPPSRPAEVVHASLCLRAPVELEPLPPIALGGSGRWPFERAVHATLLADGGFAVVDAGGTAWNFDAGGTVRSRSASGGDGGPDDYGFALVATADGCARESFRRWTAFDALGRRAEDCDGQRKRLPRKRPVLSGMHAGAELELSVWDAELRDATGRITARYERASDQRWIDSCTDAAVTTNGWVGVLDWRSDESPRETWLHLYDPSGLVRRSLDLGDRGSVRGRRVRAAGDRLLVDRPGSDALLVDPERDSVIVFRPTPIGGAGSRIVSVVPSLDGASIAVFESGCAVVRRFAWPAE